jgi:plastocyanin
LEERKKEDSMKRLLLVIAGFSVGVGLTVGTAMTGNSQAQSAAKAPAKSMIMIRHQLHGCHSWSVNGGPYRVSLKMTLARGGTITFMDEDVMPHKLVETSGPRVRYPAGPAMRRMGAAVRATFPKIGVYRFTTKPGEDYMSGVKTIGEDNVLWLTVKVS